MENFIFCAVILNSGIVSTTVLKSLLNKVADLKVCNFIQKRLSHKGSAEPYLGLFQMQRFCENRQHWHMELEIQRQSYERIFKEGALKNFAKRKLLCQSPSLIQLQTAGTYFWISSSLVSTLLNPSTIFTKSSTWLDPKFVPIVNNSNFNFKINNRNTRQR